MCGHMRKKNKNVPDAPRWAWATGILKTKKVIKKTKKKKQSNAFEKNQVQCVRMDSLVHVRTTSSNRTGRCQRCRRRRRHVDRWEYGGIFIGGDRRSRFVSRFSYTFLGHERWRAVKPDS